MSQENLGIILTDFIDALRRGDLATVEARLAPDVVWQGSATGSSAETGTTSWRSLAISGRPSSASTPWS